MFLSKNVTHIIRNEQPINMIVRLSIENTSVGNAAKATSLAKVMSPQCLKQMSDECTICLPNNHRPDFKRNLKRDDIHARKLNSPFIKVEDFGGLYRPIVMGLKEWPELNFHGTAPHSPFLKPWKRALWPIEDKCLKRKLCELCNTHYFNFSEHVNGSQHQTNAHNDELFVGLDQAIAEGPSIHDFHKRQKH